MHEQFAVLEVNIQFPRYFHALRCSLTVVLSQFQHS